MHHNSQAKLAKISQVKINCNKFSQVRLARFVKQLRSVRMGNGVHLDWKIETEKEVKHKLGSCMK